jgi:hypothetical protein
MLFRTRTFFLFEEALILCELKGDNYIYKETLPLNEYFIEDLQASSSSSSLSSSLSNSLTSSSFNLNKALNLHSLELVSSDRSKKYLIQFENRQQKETWKQSFLQAKENVIPDDHKINKHHFKLATFDRQLVKCFVCSKFLLGLFYQGYKCCLCSEIAHKDCLKKITTLCISTTSVMNQQLLEDCSWYSPVDRNTADIILTRIPNPIHQTIFMVRCSQDGGYAISIKYNGLVVHIKIDKNTLSDLNNQINLNNHIQYSLGKHRNFDSIISLVNYYCINSLKGSFHELDFTLGVPFREALPTPISYAIALHDYNPLSNPNNTGEQLDLKKNSKYFVLNKESNGWWRVYNADGLIGYVPGSYLIESKVEA